MSVEEVVLVDEHDTPLGTALKSEVHTDNTLMHRAFSCFLFRPNGNLIFQQRAACKHTWPEVWSNSCCGHPLPDESREHAVYRRLAFELGISPDHMPQVWCALPHFTYKAMHKGVMEHEYCPVYVGWYAEGFALNPEEVMAVRETPWDEFIGALLDPENSTYDELSVWCRQEAQLLHASPEFQAWYAAGAPAVTSSS